MDFNRVKGWVLRLGLVCIFVYYASNFFDWGKVTSYLSVDIVIGMLFSQIFIVASSVPLAMRLAFFVGQSRIPFWVSFQAVLFSAGLNIVLPGRASEFAKPAYFKKKEGVPFCEGLSAVFLERLSDIIIFGVLVLATLGAVWIQLDWIQLVFLITFSFLICLIFPFLEKRLLYLIKHLPFLRFREFLGGAIVHAALNMRKGRLFKGAFFGLVGWFFSFLSVWAFFVVATEGILGWQGALEIFVCTTLAYAIPALPGGLGVYEAAAVLVLRRYGFNVDEALALGISLHVAQVLVPGVVTTLILTKHDVSISYEFFTQIRKK